MRLLKNKFKKLAQTTTELAVFGAILIFMIGVIIRQALGFSQLQHNNLKAMRMALLTSYRHSEGLETAFCNASSNPDECKKGESSRNTSSILIVEDRLNPTSSKYGAIDRVPQIVNASATHSRNLFLPFEAGEDYNVPRMDIFVNGVHFPVSVGALKRLCLTPIGSPCPNGWPRPAGLEIDNTCVTYPRITFPVLVERHYVPCAVVYKITGGNTSGDWCDNALPPNPNVECVLEEQDKRIPPITFADPDCPNYPPPPTPPPAYPPTAQDDKCNLSANDRFDLDRDQDYDDMNVDGGFVSDTEDRNRFGWQWFKLKAFQANEGMKAKYGYLNRGRGIGKDTMADVDYDLKEERIIAVERNENTGVITGVQAFDMQDGDMDFTRGSNDTRAFPGFTQDVWMFTFVKDVTSPEGGTYLRIDSGKLFGAGGGQYIRSVQKKDQVDLIQRVLQLSHNTGRFCALDLNIGDPPATLDDTRYFNGRLERRVRVDGELNPVNVCCNRAGCADSLGWIGGPAAHCFNDANIARNCMVTGADTDGDTNPDADYPIIYVRSLVEDLHGRKWVTNVNYDPYVEFHY